MLTEYSEKIVISQSAATHHSPRDRFDRSAKLSKRYKCATFPIGWQLSNYQWKPSTGEEGFAKY